MNQGCQLRFDLNTCKVECASKGDRGSTRSIGLG